MQKLFLSLISIAASANAFAPSTIGRTSSALSAKPFSDALGAQPPLGLFDPLGLIEDGSQERFDILREYEIKHGRVAMLAVTGYLVTAAGIRFPGAESVPDGLAAFKYLLNDPSGAGMNVLYQMGAFFTVAEIVNRDADWLDNKAEFPGDYRNGALDFGWDSFDDATKMKKRQIELNNGRAAMMGIWGLVTHEIMGNSILPGGYLPGQ